MALGRIIKNDGRRPLSSYFSAPAIVAFVALCLVGLWMIMASSSVPLQEFSHEENLTESPPIKETNTQQTADNARNSAADLTKGGTDTDGPQDENNSDVQNNGALPDTSNDNADQQDHETESVGNEDERNDSNGISESKAENEAGKGNGGDSKITDSTPDSDNAQGAPTVTGQVESDNSSTERDHTDKAESPEVVKVGGDQEKNLESPSDNEKNDQPTDQVPNEASPEGVQSEILNETSTQNRAWSTQATESKNENKEQESTGIKDNSADGYSWKVCNVTAGPDYIPCLDNLKAIRALPTTNHYEHRERHCLEEGPTCLVPLPNGYKQSIAWPHSRDKIWYYNVPHTKLVQIKGHQNWVKVSGEYLTFPGGGTQFTHGAMHYIEFIEEIAPDIAWGKHTRVVLDVGCGVASFGGYLFDKNVITMSMAPKDEHEAQVQFALERGISAIIGVMGTQRLPFPARVFDAIHCARCRVPWHIEGGKLLLELNRLLRPGGYFVWSATPVYRKDDEDVGIWNEMSALVKSMCWDVVVINKDQVNRVGIAIFRKPSTNECYEKRRKNAPPLCVESDDPNAAWKVLLQDCMHKVPTNASYQGFQWPEPWPKRIETPPYWLKSTQLGVYGKAAPDDFLVDYEHWKRVISKSYLTGIGISWSSVRNVMDMRSVYGGFAAALKDMKVWVMNVVPIDSPDTLPVIYERGLFGIYHDWCESFNTYPRSYDLLHADHLFSKLKQRCKLVPVIAEVDRILRPGGKLIVLDNSETLSEIESMVKSMQWEVRMSFTKEKEGLLSVVKTMWRPAEVETIISSIE